MKLRPRFSVRVLVILMTLACVYFAGWRFTYTLGVKQIQSEYHAGKLLDSAGFNEIKSPAPFLVRVDTLEVVQFSPGPITLTRHWHLWFCGLKSQLPIETTWILQPDVFDAPADPTDLIQSPMAEQMDKALSIEFPTVDELEQPGERK